MQQKINEHLLNYVLNKCCKTVNPYIFEDLENGKKIYIGFSIKRRPKKDKQFSFYGLNIYNVHLKHMEELSTDCPIKDVVLLSRTENHEPIYYITTDTISAVIYVLTNEILKHDFKDEDIVELYILLSKNTSFNYEYLSRKKQLAILYYSDVYDLIGHCATYYPIRDDKFDTSISIKTPVIKKVIPIAYTNNMFIASFRKCSFGNSLDGIVFMNGYHSHTRDSLIQNNGHYCMLCGKYDEDIQWHHILPRSLDGSNNYYNASLLCPSCHKLIHDCQKSNPTTFNSLTLKIIRNKFKLRAIYQKIKGKGLLELNL